MSNEALRRTIRRTGAVVVFAVGTLTMSFRDYATYEDVPMPLPGFVLFLLLVGPLVYLAGSFLFGVFAAFEGDLQAEPADGERAADDGTESVAGAESADGAE